MESTSWERCTFGYLYSLGSLRVELGIKFLQQTENTPPEERVTHTDRGLGLDHQHAVYGTLCNHVSPRSMT